MSSNGEYSFGCLFCSTGKEREVAQRIMRVCPDVTAVAVMQEKHRSHHGQKSRVTEVALPGYVFFTAPNDPTTVARFPRIDVIRILRGSPPYWQLAGSDEAFARWVFEYHGVLQFSRAYQAGDRVYMLSGPLKDMEAQIVRVDKRGRSGQVEVRFDDRAVRLWLGFDLIKPSNENGT